jgi:hypothetical protein
MLASPLLNRGSYESCQFREVPIQVGIAFAENRSLFTAPHSTACVFIVPGVEPNIVAADIEVTVNL